MKVSAKNIFALSLAAYILTGCAGTPTFDKEKGASVKQMLVSQVYDPSTLTNPPEIGPLGADGKTSVIKMQKTVREGETTRQAKEILVKRRFSDVGR